VPIYEYVCKNAHKTVKMRSINTPVAELDIYTCETCNEPAELAVSKPGRPILKGAGFHENDYRHGNLGS
jgi:predicted nucleic acid-binding Zn ribbon protein